MTNEDFYQTLGVNKSASDAEIKAAYRKKALEWHPDRNKSAEATTKFKQINEAYEILSNSEKRSAYDQFGPAAFQQGGMGGPGGPFGGQSSSQQGPFTYTYRTYGSGNNTGNPFEGTDFSGFSDPFEIFEQFFGGGFGGAGGGPRRARRQVYSLTISFMEAVKGTEKTVDIGGKPMTIKIPAGVDESSRVRFDNFDIVVSVRTDKTFQRQGPDVFVNAEISYPDAALGTTINVPTIDGSVELKIPAGTQPGNMIRLRGRGAPIPRSGARGDEYVRIKIMIPSKLTAQQKKILEDLRNSSNSKRSGWF